jgi:hypothetical protein
MPSLDDWFRAITGMDPKELRERHREIAEIQKIEAEIKALKAQARWGKFAAIGSLGSFLVAFTALAVAIF